jgi:hypothetical protein
MKLLKGAAIASMAAVGVLACALAGAAEKTEKNKTAGSGPNPYRDCGIGAALFSETGWAAVTSNVIWDLGLTALTSATSSPETCSGKNVKVAQFIIDTYDNVVDETAAGSGDHLTAMLEIYGCSAPVHEQIVKALRPAVAQEVSSPEYAGQSLVDKSTRYFQLIDHEVNTQFAQACAA